MGKNILFIMRRAPHEGDYTPEMLDVIMTLAAFDQPVRVLFVDDGVFQLKKDQNPADAGLKHVAPMFHALPIYDVQELIVEMESLHERRLAQTDLMLPVQLLPRNRIAALMDRQDVILNG
jgi:tRNA 2-thiouridine synthesizing protein C